MPDGNFAFVDWNVLDSAGNDPWYRSPKQTYVAPGASGSPISGGGILVIQQPPPVVAIPSLVNLFPSTNTIYLPVDATKEYRIAIQSVSDSDINVSIALSENIAGFFNLVQEEPLVGAKQVVVWKWLVSIPEDLNFTETVLGVLTVNLAGQEEVEIDVVLQPAAPSLFDVSFMGLPIVYVGLIGVTLGGVYVYITPKSKRRFF